VYDALSTRFTNVKLRGRRSDCAACSASSKLKEPDGVAAYDYAAFIGGQSQAKGGPLEAPQVPGNTEGPLRVLAADLHRMLGESGGAAVPTASEDGSLSGTCGQQVGPLLVDVRPKELYAAARLPGSMHVPMREV
jgi:hypothetical protein